MALLSPCLFIVLVSSLAHRNAEAVPTLELNRALLAYNRGYDLCREVTESTHFESKRAVDNECERAFKALDLLQYNSCRGWRNAACRLIPGEQLYQCTCQISSCDSHTISTGVVTSFRTCAQTISAEEQRIGQALVPTANYQWARKDYDEALAAVEARRYFDFSSYYDISGSPSEWYAFGGAPSSSGVKPSDGAAMTSGVSNLGTPDSFGIETDKIPRPYACDQCDGAYRSARKLFDHKRIHHAEGDSHCYKCNRTYKNKEALLGHFRLRHPITAKVEIASRRVPSNPAEAAALLPYICDFCGQRYSSYHGLRDHKRSHTTSDTQCPACGKVLSTRASLKIHMGRRHPGEPMPEPASGSTIKAPEEGPFVCGVCENAYVTKKGLKDHEASHLSLETYCKSCDKTLSNKANYKLHIELKHPELAKGLSEATKAQHDEKYKLECNQCGKRIKTARGLRDHKFFHAGKTTCEVCNETFQRKSYLSAHKRSRHPKGSNNK